MADEATAKDAKLIQYLNEAYGKEKELERALQADISMTTRPTYKKRLQDHLKETKAQARSVERRIKQLGGKAETTPAPVPDAAPDVVAGAATVVTSAASQAISAAKGPLHALRGTGEQEKMLKNAKTEYWNEHEEIATYTSIETLAETVGDRDTVKLARDIRRQEERMAKFLERIIPQLTKAVAQEEIPASERRTASRRPARSRTRSGGARSASRSGATRSAGARSASRSGATRSGGARSASRSGATRSARAGAGRAAATSRSRATTSGRSSSRSGGAQSSRSPSGGRSGSRRSASRGR